MTSCRVTGRAPPLAACISVSSKPITRKGAYKNVISKFNQWSRCYIHVLMPYSTCSHTGCTWMVGQYVWNAIICERRR